MCMSPSLSCLISMVCKMTISMMGVRYFRCTMWEMMKSFAICWCVIVGPGDVNVLVLLLIPLLKLLHGSLFLCGVDLFLFEFNGCCRPSWLSISFNTSENSFSNVGTNLSLSKCKGSICMVYLLLVCIASFLTWFISSLCTFLLLTGSTKLISLPLLLNFIFTLL